MKKAFIFVFIVVVLVGSAVFFISRINNDRGRVMTIEEYQIYVVDTLVKEAYPGVDSYDANTLINVFSGLINQDFNGIDTEGGVYRVIEGGIIFYPNDGEFSEEKQYLGDDAIRALLTNVARRLNMDINTREGFETLIMRIK